MKTRTNYFLIVVLAFLFLIRPSIHAATPLESKVAPLPDLLEYAMKGITNRALFQYLCDKQEVKYIFIVTAYSGQREASNSSSLYMPWRLLQSMDTNQTFKLVGAGSYVEFTMSITNAKTPERYGVLGSGLPQGSSNWLASMGVQLWANKELGDCDDIYHLHSDNKGTNFTVLVAKAGGKWIILEIHLNPEYTGYFARGDSSYIPNGENDPANKSIPNAPKPMVFDSPSKFEDYYGKVKVIDTQLGKVRIWRKGNVIISHMDDSPKRPLVAVEKIGEESDFNEREIFEVAERYCGKQEWILDEKSERWSIYNTKDHKFKLTWSHKDIKEGATSHERVTLQYFIVNEDIQKL